MKAITICPPYPSLIMLPESSQHHKRVENRTWPTNYRGPLLIHSGKSKQWEGSYDLEVEMRLPRHYGMIVGVVDLVECFAPADSLIKTPHLLKQFPWLLRHQHVSGPWCHIYANPRRFAEPIPYRGTQGFFDVPDSIVAKAVESAVAV